MTTSLARQLQALRSDVVATLDKRKHHRVASLLFDPDEAAGQTLEAIYSLGVNGLSGLVLLEPQFERFGQTLFAENAKEIDRAVQVLARWGWGGLIGVCRPRQRMMMLILGLWSFWIWLRRMLLRGKLQRLWNG
jgi:hypothetical protein